MHRWATTIELAEAADHTARLGSRLLPQAAVAELTAVRRLAAAVERDALADPPAAAGFALLDRLVPSPGPPPPAVGATPLDAAAALVAALDRAQRVDGLTLRDFRAAVAAAEITSRSAATITAAATGDDVGPLLVTGLAWQLAGRTSMAFHDAHRAGPCEARGVVAWAQALAGALRAEVGSHADTAALHGRSDLALSAGRVRQVTAQLPVLGDHLAAAVDRWSHTGRLYTPARHLPRTDTMPEDRITAVIAGRHVRASGADLDRLRRVVDRAADLSTGLADALHRAVGNGPAVRPHQVDRHNREVRAPGAAERLLDRAQAVYRDTTTMESPHQVAREAPSR